MSWRANTRFIPRAGVAGKKLLVSGGAGIFPHGKKESKDEPKLAETELDEQIGRRKMELEWLKKNLNRFVKTKRAIHSTLSIRQQCELIGLKRATLYAKPQGETALNLHLMRLIDEQ